MSMLAARTAMRITFLRIRFLLSWLSSSLYTWFGFTLVRDLVPGNSSFLSRASRAFRTEAHGVARLYPAEPGEEIGETHEWTRPDERGRFTLRRSTCL